MARLHPHHRLFNLLSPLSTWFTPAPLEMRLRMLSTAAAYTIHVSMHGMRKGDINVLVTDGVLLIEAERKHRPMGGSPQLPPSTPSLSHSLPQLRPTTEALQQSINAADEDYVNGDGEIELGPKAAAAHVGKVQDEEVPFESSREVSGVAW
jgi:hypothetical protein